MFDNSKFQKLVEADNLTGEVVAVNRFIVEVKGLPDGFKTDDLKKLSYMGQVIEESLRLYGAAPGDLPRAVPAGGKRLCGHYIPGGLTVTTQAYTMHRDPQIFPEPEKLAPCMPFVFELQS